MATPRLLTDTHQLLAEAVQAVGTAIRQPPRHRRAVAEHHTRWWQRRRRRTRRQRRTARHDPALDALRRLAEHAALCAVTASDTVQAVTGQRPSTRWPARCSRPSTPTAAPTCSSRATGPTDVNLRPWHDEADTLTRLIRTHSQKPTIAAPVARGATHSPPST